MGGCTKARGRAGGLAALIGLALLSAGCGSSGGSKASTSAGSTTPTDTVVIGTTNGPVGTYLTDADGRALYLWDGDGKGKSNCSGTCATSWPPLTSDGTPTTSDGVTAADVATITRSDGTKQVTYMDHPLYYFANDAGPGTTIGEGSDSFGAHWWLVAPSGVAITKVPPPAGY